MPATSSGRIIKIRKVKKGTLHQKNHRWESFTTKISKLSSLDPIRRVRRHDIDAEDLSATTSYFKAGVEKWQELNMSKGFISFSQDVLPLCDSLPQILHFEDKIMELLITYIEKREKESLEPLLELVTDFAHDLGLRFEKHYAKTLELVTAIAGTPQDVAVIEWSFTCLAFMFKYLSKLLVLDLRPTYDLMAPLLGKHRQPPHIARFAAEAMSFLVKKAGAPANREEALPLIVRHAKLDLESIVGAREFNLYYYGLMTLFAEAMKGNGLSIHTSGPEIFKALFTSLDERDLKSKEPSPWMDVICGVLTSMVHHTSSDTFKDILDMVMDRAKAAVDSFAESRTEQELSRLLLSARTIGIAAGVRKGTRVRDWPQLLETLNSILQAVSKNAATVITWGQDTALWNFLILSVSITLQYTPMDAVIPFISKFMDALSKEPLAKWFLPFCWYLSQAEPERFRNAALQPFKRFIMAHWSEDNGDTLCVLLPKMVASGVLPSNYGKDGFTLPQSWQDQIVSKFERLEVQPFPEQASPAVYDRSPKTWHDRCLPKYNALLEVLQCTKVHPSTNARIAEILLRKLKLALRPSSSLAPEEAHFIVGRGFTAFSRMVSGIGEADRALEPLLRAAAPRYARLPKFLEALLAYEKSLELSPPPVTVNLDADQDGDLLVNSLIGNLSTESPELRLLSLRLLEHIHNIESGTNSEALSLMIMIEQTPLDLQTARSVSMHIRRLALLYPQQPAGSWLKEAIPSFCFGMFNVKFAQIWEDASASLKQISESKDGDGAVAKLAFDWLETPSLAWNGGTRNVEQLRNSGLTDFECSNLMKLDELAKEAESGVLTVRDTMLQQFDVAQQLVAARPASARAQALRVLAAAPGIAEKRSRQLVPMFLSWASKQGDDGEQSGDDPESVISDWTRKDQNAQLDLFGLFVNPKSLYKSDEVYAALLRLLANGDVERQKAALKAIFTWKNRSVRPYEENLLNLLDEARFKDEITILLQGQTLVQEEHRADLMPVLLRLLYGRAISRKGAASGKQGMQATRLTVLRNLTIEGIEGFIDIALGELREIDLIQDGQLNNSVVEREIIDVRKQAGTSIMIESVLKELGTKVAPFTQRLLDAVLYCIIYSSRLLQNDLEETDEDSNPANQTSLLKVVRQTGLKCLILLFSNSENFDWSPYATIIINHIVLPRLENLPVETAQGISGILRLFSTWSTSSKTAILLLGHDERILPKVAECLAPPKSKDEVKLFALGIVKNIVHLCRGSDTANGTMIEDAPVHSVKDVESRTAIQNVLLTPNIDHFLIQIGSLLRTDPKREVLEGCVETVSELAPFVRTSSQAGNLVEVSISLLDQPARRVSPKIKAGLLKVLEHFVPLYDLHDDKHLKDKIYDTITSQFGYFKDKESREVLSRVLMVYSHKDPVIGEVAELCIDLNSFVAGRLDEPDYTRRGKAFGIINTHRNVPFTARQWRPLLFNMLYYIRQEEEFAFLSPNSSECIRQFVTIAAITENELEKSSFMTLISTILMPDLFKGARDPSEVIRREYLNVMAHLIKEFPSWPEVSDMHGLLAGDDELESSFFKNILAVGKGRQSGAFKQLSAAAGELSSKNVSRLFIPLLEHFIFDRAEGSDAHSLAAEATTTVGILAGSLEWGQYKEILKRFIGYIKEKPDLQKQIIRLLGKVIDSLAEAAAQFATEQDGDISEKKQSMLGATMPKQPKLADDLTKDFLTTLTAYLHEKDESTVSLRVPVAVIVVRLLKLLPDEQLNERLPAVLTDVCHILRSKAQESRDMTRDTLVKICVLLGPSCFGFVLKELRGSLARGYQLHVLSYTMHSILVATIPGYAPGDLDYCLPSIVAIIMDDIFGATGQEKDAEEYVSKMKEVKSRKSHDSMELIAQTATLSRLTDLVRPIQMLLKEKLNKRMAAKIDELLNRISSGLLKNSAAQTRDSLVFCYEVIQDVYNSDRPEKKAKEDYRLKKYLIQKGAKRAGDRGSTTVHTYKLVRFAFDVLRSVVQKSDYLRTSKNLAGFIPIIGDAIAQGEEEVKVAAFRILTTIVKVPFQVTNDGTDLYRIATAEALKCIRSSSSTVSDISQASLKLISVILRDRDDVPIKDSAIDDLLTKLKDDMTEPERRHVTFRFLRAIMDSKVETAVVYDTLDYVGTIMVTNDDKDTRTLARGAYFQFLRDYPQKKRRWEKQLEFIIDNLKYEREGGRLSILDLLLSLLSKSSDNFVQEIAASSFLPLIFVLANDESETCSKGAGELIKLIFSKADKERSDSFLKVLRTMVQQESPAAVRVAMQTFGFYYEAQSMDDSDVTLLQERILHAIQTAEDAEVIYPALQLTHILVDKFPTTLLSSNSAPLWKAVRTSLSYPHQEVKLSATSLIRTYLEDFARNNGHGVEELPLKNSGGLTLKGDDIVELLRRTVQMLKTPELRQDLADSVVKNLTFLAICAGVNNVAFRTTDDSDGEDEGEDEVMVVSDPEQRTALQFLFGRLSFILRRESTPPRAPVLIPKTAALELISTLTAKLSSTILLPCLPAILLPLQTLTDPQIPTPYSTDELFRANYSELKTNSTDIMDKLKEKIGTKEYTDVSFKVGKERKEKRMERSKKRKIERVAQPEKAGEVKRKKVVRKKERRKERGEEHKRARNEY